LSAISRSLSSGLRVDLLGPRDVAEQGRRGAPDTLVRLFQFTRA
jgi:hypothetical protein